MTGRAGDGADPVEFEARVRLDTPNEVRYYQHGGILHRVLRDLALAAAAATSQALSIASRPAGCPSGHASTWVDIAPDRHNAGVRKGT